MIQKISKKMVVERYANKDRLFNYISRTKDGLNQEEEIVFRKYIPQKSSVLVVGCGTGREIYGLRKLGFYDITGVDISPDMIAAAKKIIRKVAFYCADINEFNVNRKFDCVVFPNNILEQIPSLKNRQKAIEKAKMLLRKNGVAIFTTHSRFIPGYLGSAWIKNLVFYLLYKLKAKKTSPFDFIDIKQKIYSHYSNPLWIRSVIKKTGFIILEINSKHQIINGQKRPLMWLLDEPIYYIAHSS